MNSIQTARTLAILDGMGLAAHDGKCRPFDQRAQGYAVSDCCAAFFLQRATDARRNWATIIGADYRYFGNKKGGLLDFDGQPAKEMLRQLYAEWNVDPESIGYIEADGSGIKEQDLEEVDVISEIFCQNRKEPMLIGSVKSNMGHAQSAACGAGMVKALIALNKSRIPPTIHCDSPIPELSLKGLKVVTSSTALDSEFVAVNVIGIGGHFGHLLLRKNSSKTPPTRITKELPQLLVMSARSENGINTILEQTKSITVTREFADLLNGVFRQNLPQHLHRGYKIVSSDAAKDRAKSERTDSPRRPIWWVFSGMGSQFNGMGIQLMHISIFRDVIERCDKVLAPYGIDIKHILTTDDESIFDDITNSFVGITAVQLGLIELLKALGLEPDRMIGHSLGELACANADNCMTLEETILASYSRGRASNEAPLIKGMMAAVGVGSTDIAKLLPESIDIACLNSDTSCTLSGPVEDVEKFVAELHSKGIFAKAVNVGNIAYHSRYIQPAGPLLLKYLREVLPEKKKLSRKWISTSVPKSKWNTDLGLHSSPEYHTNNLLSPVLFGRVLKSVPKDAILIEIAPHGLLQAILKRAVRNSVSNVPLTNKTSPDARIFLLEAIGRLHILGLEPNVSALYPPVIYPVPSSTPTLQPFVTWDHSQKYGNLCHLPLQASNMLDHCERVTTLENIKKSLESHKDGASSISPLSFFLVEIWKMFGVTDKTRYAKIPVAFEDIQIYSELNINTTDSSNVYLSVLPGKGDFSVMQETKKTESSVESELTTLICGKIRVCEKAPSLGGFAEKISQQITSLIEKSPSPCKVTADSCELQLCNTGAFGAIKWSSNLAVSLNRIMSVHRLHETHKTAKPVKLASIRFLHLNPMEIKANKEGSMVEFCMDNHLRRFKCNGVNLDYLKTEVDVKDEQFVERISFVPYGETSFMTEDAFLEACLQVIHENSWTPRTTMDNAVVVNVVKPSPEHDTDRFVCMLKDAADSLYDELNIELKFREPTDEIPTSETLLSVMSDVNDNLKPMYLNHTGNTFILRISHLWQKFSVPNGSKEIYAENRAVIYEQTFGIKRLTLLKKVGSFKTPSTCLVTKDWRSVLEKLKSDATRPGDKIHLVIDGSSLALPLFPMKEVSRELFEYDVRCYLVSQCKKSVLTSLERIYLKQIERDVAINVLVNGRWGCYRRQTIRETAMTRIFRGMSRRNSKPKSLDVRYISLAETDFKNCRVEKTVLDYSAITCEGDRVVGLASGDVRTSEISPDPELQWKLPVGFSLEGGTTLPYAFTMANLVMRDLPDPGGAKKTVLVHSGHSPIGTTCIAIALSEGHSVYTTVPDDTAKEQILRNFPQIPESRITDYNNKNFFVPLMIGTGGLGADLIISDLPREQMIASWQCIARKGCFVNLNESVLAHNAPLPMRYFDGMTAFYSFKSADLLAFAPERKRRLHKLVDDCLKTGGIVKIPYRALTVNETDSVCSINPTLGEKLVLKLFTGEKLNEDKERLIEKSDSQDDKGSSVIFCSTIHETSSLVQWLIQQGTKKLTIITLHSNGRLDIPTGIKDFLRKHNVIVSIIPGEKVLPQNESGEMLRKLLMTERFASIFTVFLGQNTTVLNYIKQAMEEMDQQIPIVNIDGEPGVGAVPSGVISLVVNETPNYGMALDHAMLSSDTSSVYVVSNRSRPRIKNHTESTGVQTESITNFLPSSVRDMEEMGRVLASRDATCNAQTVAKFIPTTTRAPLLSSKLHADIQPLFIIPAFCETELRPLISKLMYPCFVAQINPDAKSVNQIASSLLKSMTEIQKSGPYSLVAESWNGGLGVVLSRLFSEINQEVTLFLLQGLPDRMQRLLPAESTQSSIDQFLAKVLFRELNQSDDKLTDTRTAINLLPDDYNKIHVRRAVRTIQKTLRFSMDYGSVNTLQSELFVFEMAQTNSQLTDSDIQQMSEKTTKVVRSDRRTFKKMLADPLVHSTINEETPFRWSSQ
nr:PREDICTED: fatty acid synthase-like [Bemisia tabaci]